MKLPLSKILLILCLPFVFLNPVFSEPANLSLLKKEVINYHDSGLYYQELTQTINKAQQYITAQALLNKKNKTPQRLALVLDIDETSISNYNNIIKRDFMGAQQQIHEEIMAADAPVIEPMLALYNNALKNNISVFFVTGRHESERDATEKNLLKAGYTNWSGLYLRPDEYSAPSIIPFKSGARATIAKKGYVVIASIGDQLSDISGGYAQKGFKLPNPFYYLP